MTSHCTTDKFHSKVKIEENCRKAVFQNNLCSHFSVTKIDNCVVTEGPRADYLISKVGSASAIVELKGKDVDHACDQLFASAKHPDVVKLLENKLGFLVVCSRYPRFDTYVMRAKTRAAKEFKAGFHIVCNKGEFDIDKLCSISGK